MCRFFFYTENATIICAHGSQPYGESIITYFPEEIHLALCTWLSWSNIIIWIDHQFGHKRFSLEMGNDHINWLHILPFYQSSKTCIWQGIFLGHAGTHMLHRHWYIQHRYPSEKILHISSWISYTYDFVSNISTPASINMLLYISWKVIKTYFLWTWYPVVHIMWIYILSSQVTSYIYFNYYLLSVGYLSPFLSQACIEQCHK